MYYKSIIELRKTILEKLLKVGQNCIIGYVIIRNNLLKWIFKNIRHKLWERFQAGKARKNKQKKINKRWTRKTNLNHNLVRTVAKVKEWHFLRN